MLNTIGTGFLLAFGAFLCMVVLQMCAGACS